MMRWKMTLSYLPVEARVAKFFVVCWMCQQLARGMVAPLGRTHSWDLVFVERNGDVAHVGVHQDALMGLVATHATLRLGHWCLGLGLGS